MGEAEPPPAERDSGGPGPDEQTDAAHHQPPDEPGAAPPRTSWIDILKPENVKPALEAHDKLIQDIQSVIFLRRPIATLVIFLLINFHFWVFSVVAESFYTLVLFALCYTLILTNVGKTFLGVMNELLFRREISKGSDSELNRIRPVSEFFGKILYVSGCIWSALHRLERAVSDNSHKALISRAVVYFTLFVITAVLNLLWPVVILTNFMLLAPGLWLHPKSVQMRADLWAKIGGKTE
jgi:hypothetical protein